MAQGDHRGSLTASVNSVTNPTNLTGSVAVSVGDLIFGVFAQQTALTAAGTVTDNLGHSYAYVNAGTDAGNVTIRCFWVRATNAGTLTQVSVPATASTNDASAIASVIEGPFQTSPLNANPANTTDGTSPHTCPATGALSQEPQVVMAACAVASNVTMTATSPGVLTQAVGRSNASSAVSRTVVSSTSSVTPEFGNGATANAAQTTASFKLVMRGTGAVSLGGITIAAAAAQEFLSTAAMSLSTVALAGTGSGGAPTHTSTGAITLTAPTLVASATEEFTGAGALTLTVPVLAATGAEEFAGAGALQLTGVVLSGVGEQTQEHAGAGALSLTALVLAASGAEEFAGAGAVSLDEPTLSGVGSAPYVGDGALSLTAPVLAASGAEEFAGAGAVVLQFPTVAATGTQVHEGAGAVVLQFPTVAASGAEEFAGAGDVDLTAVQIAASGAEEFAGAGAVLLATIEIAASGSHVLTFVGAGAITLQAAEITAQALSQSESAVATLILDGVEITAAGGEELPGQGAILLVHPTLSAQSVLEIAGAGAVSLISVEIVALGSSTDSTDGAGAIVLTGVVIATLGIGGVGDVSPPYPGRVVRVAAEIRVVRLDAEVRGVRLSSEDRAEEAA